MLSILLNHFKSGFEISDAALVFISADYTLEEKRTESSLLEELERGLAEPLVFVLNANLLAVVKIVSCML